MTCRLVKLRRKATVRRITSGRTWGDIIWTAKSHRFTELLVRWPFVSDEPIFLLERHNQNLRIDTKLFGVVVYELSRANRPGRRVCRSVITGASRGIFHIIGNATKRRIITPRIKPLCARSATELRPFGSPGVTTYLAIQKLLNMINRHRVRVSKNRVINNITRVKITSISRHGKRRH